MNETQRSQVRDNARYLRQIRPVDPAEIHEYVGGQPHPAAIRQVLREEAPDLGLLEREDGRFEPVPEEPLAVTFEGIESLPSGIDRAVEDLLVERFGPGWPDGESGATLRATIRDFKRQYLAGGTVTYDEETVLGYAVYHLPAYFVAVQYVLAELAADGLVGRHLRVLDVGAGVGGPALGLSAFVDDATLVEYHAIEPSPAAGVLDRLLAETGRNVHTTVHREPIEAFEPSVEAFDLVLFANVLSELDDPAGQVERATEWLDPGGSVVALSPADRNTAIGLRKVERAVEAATNATVYGPTVRLWPHERPESNSWSFVRRKRLETPAVQHRLDKGDRTTAEHGRQKAGDTPASDEPAKGDSPDGGAGGAGPPGSNPNGDSDPERLPGDGEFVNVDVQYAYSVLRLDGEQAVEFRPTQGRVTKLATSERHVTERVDCVAVKLSPDLSTGGNPLFLVGDGSQHIDHFAVLTESSTLNRALQAAGYGDVLSIENTLVLWNDDEGAYNLVVDGETVVDRIPA
jgi:SAM-dependent methyltransferase